MHLDMDFIHLASDVITDANRKLPLQAFFWSTKLHRDVQPLPIKGNASEMTLYASFWRTIV
ncbi:MAG: hypothetical protein COB20_16165 [SAR86 cluster bacterium]|uniref:Uncharacterized protein n=1 Tax=SAR86 cluster bacterium TaxID=2030880 RepID=A0A2A4WT22_9GAMM|nr:MAG: hypothetical protein COB20_16165 [SAR86 cluster bacterium]